jgi:transcriptional regulator PpsR
MRKAKKSGFLLRRSSAPRKAIGSLDAQTAEELIAAATDILLSIDKSGVIRDVIYGRNDLAGVIRGEWLGKLWADTATAESRPRVAMLLQDAASKSERRWRQIDHPAKRGADVPILYSTVQAGIGGSLIAVGRDLRAIAALRQQLVHLEHSTEKELSRLRHAETRYALLLQIASEGILVVEVSTSKVIEANPAAAQLIDTSLRRLVGRRFPDGFDEQGGRDIEALLAAVRTTGRGEGLRARLAVSGRELMVRAALFRQQDAAHILILMRAAEAAAEPAPTKSRLLEVLEAAPDGLVVTGPRGEILTANRAFLDFAQLATVEQARGQPLDRWVGRQSVDMRVLLGNLRRHGSVRVFATTLRGEYGSSCDVEVAAVAVLSAAEPSLGFTIRRVGKRAPSDSKTPREPAHSAEDLTELIGRSSLRELVRETTDVIERRCIEAALKLTDDNRATAAQLLGLSRQSLYAKLRRHGLGELAPHAT